MYRSPQKYKKHYKRTQICCRSRYCCCRFSNMLWIPCFYISLSDQVTEGDNLSYLPFSEKIKLLQDFFNNQIQCKTIVAYDMKSHYKMLWHGCGISLKQNCVDPSIAAWLLDPALGQQSLKLLSYNYLPDLVSVLEGKCPFIDSLNF
ncbi:DNA-directed DNA polymerase [Caerostris extrusa]|uniref:DNA-directed DNA polymerase n=1 Tax=Caerostris extrusa TaxID=172846 RepID=A0AAV4VD96_CAEEX|nr:DNA-directed DNA polymerase [Caerostris extrusa]